MNKKSILTIFTIAIAAYILSSCSVTSHPNEQTIIGKWKPVKVEKVLDSAAMKAEASLKGDTPGQNPPKPGTSAVEGGGANTRQEANLDRLVQSEMRAIMEIFPNHTAVKNFPGKPLNATWKMKGKGKRIVAKNVENKMKFTIEILEISKEQITVIEHAPVGDIKIVYERVL
jgi:hypothetical protein